MASSSYYWQRYREKKDEAKRHQKNWKELNKILESLGKDFGNNVSDINKKLDSCEEKLTTGVRHVPSISNQTSALNDIKERVPELDRNISAADDNLRCEINDLKNKEQAADDAAEQYRRQAEAAEEAERAAAAAAAEAAAKQLFGGT